MSNANPRLGPDGPESAAARTSRTHYPDLSPAACFAPAFRLEPPGPARRPRAAGRPEAIPVRLFVEIGGTPHEVHFVEPGRLGDVTLIVVLTAPDESQVRVGVTVDEDEFCTCAQYCEWAKCVHVHALIATRVIAKETPQADALVVADAADEVRR